MTEQVTRMFSSTELLKFISFLPERRNKHTMKRITSLSVDWGSCPLVDSYIRMPLGAELLGLLCLDLLSIVPLSVLSVVFPGPVDCWIGGALDELMRPLMLWLAWLPDGLARLSHCMRGISERNVSNYSYSSRLFSSQIKLKLTWFNFWDFRAFPYFLRAFKMNYAACSSFIVTSVGWLQPIAESGERVGDYRSDSGRSRLSGG